MESVLATIVNFSTNEVSFLRHCLEEVLYFSDQVIVPVCDHFFDATPENKELLHSIYAEHPQIQFVQYAWSKDNFYGNHSSYFWHNLSRLMGFHFLKPAVNAVLFIDVDEIIEGKRFATWLKQFPVEEYSALRLANYWYFREAKFRAKEIEDTPLLTSRAALYYDALMHPHERAGTFHLLEGKKKRWVLKENPFVHHYSWVRSKDALLRKVRTWGHRSERDWEALIEREFSGPFSGRDFVHGYEFMEIEPYLKTSEYTHSDKRSENVVYLTTRDIHKIDLELKFGPL